VTKFNQEPEIAINKLLKPIGWKKTGSGSLRLWSLFCETAGWAQWSKILNKITTLYRALLHGLAAL
jgi:hypothetical protein